MKRSVNNDSELSSSHLRRGGGDEAAARSAPFTWWSLALAIGGFFFYTVFVIFHLWPLETVEIITSVTLIAIV